VQFLSLPDTEDYTVAIGVTWALAAAALFSVFLSRRTCIYLCLYDVVFVPTRLLSVPTDAIASSTDGIAAPA